LQYKVDNIDVKVDNKIDYQEIFQKDLYTILALEFHKLQDYNSASKMFEKIYKIDNSYIYMIQVLKNSVLAKQYQYMLDFIQNEQSLYKDKQLDEILFFKALAYKNLNKYDKSIEILQKLLKNEKQTKYYQLIAEIYYEQKNYQQSARYYESSYLYNKNIVALLKLSDILFAHLNQQNKAISYIRTYITQNGCDKDLCIKLFGFYEYQKNINGQIYVLKELYKYYDKLKFDEGKMTVYDILLPILEKQSLDLAIDFLEKTKSNLLKLSELYIKKKMYKRSIKVLEKLYKQTNDINLLAQISMLKYQYYPNKKEILPSIISNMEAVLSIIDNDVYQNFLGYLYIDYEIDIPKGINLIKTALKKQPNYTSYLDSLAWGYYKAKECKNAKIYIDKVIEQIGLDDNEIKFHYEQIKRCLDKN